MARKGWDSLSSGYRARLERQGVTRAQYESGASLHKARGHTSAQHEQVSRRQNDAYNYLVTEFARLYGRDPDEIREALGDFTKAEIYSAVKQQKEAQRLYNEGRTAEARAIWEMRDTSLPDWMFYYHGYFS